MLTAMSVVASRAEVEREPMMPSVIEGARESAPVEEVKVSENQPTAEEPPPAQSEQRGVPKTTHEPALTSPEEMRERAVALANQGFHIFPLKRGTKRPMFNDWENLATTDPGKIARWWNAIAGANIGIACGPSNLFVIDLDKAKKPGAVQHGDQTLTALADGRELPLTLTVASARGGRHLYFRQPEGAALRNTAGSATAGLGPLIDTRGHGGFIVAPGSVFEGGSYRVENVAPVAPLPSWIVDELTRRKPVAAPAPAPARLRIPTTDRRRSAYGNTALNRSADAVATAPEGTRNDTLNREAFRMGRLVGGGVLQRDDVENELGRAAHDAGLSPGETSNTIASGLSAGTRHPRSIPDRDPLPRARQQLKDSVMTATPDREPEPVVQTTAASSAKPDAGPIEAPGRGVASSPADISPNVSVDSASEPESATELDADVEGVWGDLRASFDGAQQVLRDWADGDEADDLTLALNETSRLIAEAVTSGRDDDAPTHVDQAVSDESPAFVESVDSAYADALTVGTFTEAPEWTGISAIRSEIHNLWETVRAVASRYWAELSADIRVVGPLNALANRAARGIANLASRAANHLEERGLQQQRSVDSLAGLREAYINARSQVRAHAATHEWQRISALWGTVSTLARQAGDPGIRAVVARSADAISDHAEALARRAGQTVQAGASDALTNLARAAERHAVALRTSDDQLREAGPSPASAVAVSASKLTRDLSTQQDTEARALQAKAHEVARLVQGRRGLQLGVDAVPRSPHGANVALDRKNDSMRNQPPTPSQESVRCLRW